MSGLNVYSHSFLLGIIMIINPWKNMRSCFPPVDVLPFCLFFLWSCVRTKMVKGKSALILLPSYLYYNSHHFTSLTTILFSLDFFPFVFLYFFPGRKRAKRHTYKWKKYHWVKEYCLDPLLLQLSSSLAPTTIASPYPPPSSSPAPAILLPTWSLLFLFPLEFLSW